MIGSRIFWDFRHNRYVQFTGTVLRHMEKYQQKWWNWTEAGGELFSPQPDADGMTVTAIAGPSDQDLRRRYRFRQDVSAADIERERHAEQGLHAVGLWHTHPEKEPIPSKQDRETTEKYWSYFEGDRKRYFLIVVGYGCLPVPMSVWSYEGDIGWTEWTE